MNSSNTTGLKVQYTMIYNIHNIGIIDIDTSYDTFGASICEKVSRGKRKEARWKRNNSSNNSNKNILGDNVHTISSSAKRMPNMGAQTSAAFFVSLILYRMYTVHTLIINLLNILKWSF